MKKTALLTVAILTVAIPTLAQNVDLFPELKGQFKPAFTTPKEPAQPDNKTMTQPIQQQNIINTQPVQTMTPNINLDVNQRREGNIKLKLKNLKGVLPYARNFSYCFADVELTNGTNQTLQELKVTLRYQGAENNLIFSGVSKGQKQIQKLMMNGPECASILTIPQMDITSCKLENQSDDACKKRVQFSGPNEL